MDGKYEHAFIHLTHKNEFHNSNNPNDRVPDPRRAERIGWNKPIIEQYPCNEECLNCSKILYFEKLHGKNVRSYFLLKDFRFMVIIEKRNNYNFNLPCSLAFGGSLRYHLASSAKSSRERTTA